MARAYFILFFILIVTVCKGQNAVDVLPQDHRDADFSEWSNIDKADYFYDAFQMDSSIYYNNLALQKALAEKSDSAIVSNLIRMGQAYNYQPNPDSADYYLNKAIAYSTNKDYPDNDYHYMSALIDKGLNQEENLGNEEKAYQLYSEAFTIADSIGDFNSLLDVTWRLCNITWIRGNYDKVLDLSTYAYQKAKDIKGIDQHELLHINSWKAIVMGLTGKDKTDRQEGLEILQNNAAVFKEKKENLDYLFTVVDILEFFGRDLTDDQIEDYSSILHDNMEDVDLGSRQSLVDFYYASALRRQSRYEEAIPIIEKVIGEARKFKNYQLTLSAYRELIEVYRSQGNFTKIAGILDDYTNAVDSNALKVYNKELLELQTKFETQQKELENSRLELENRRIKISNRNIIFGLIGISVLAILVLGFYIHQRNQKKKYKDLFQSKELLLHILSHDLRGPLHGLQGIADKVNYLINTKDFTRLDQLGNYLSQSTLKASNIIDSILLWGSADRTSFYPSYDHHNLHQILEDIIPAYQSQSVYQGKELIYQPKEEAMIYTDKNILSTIIRNVLDNAIKNGKKSSSIHIHTEEKNKAVQILISNQTDKNADNIAATVNQALKTNNRKNILSTSGFGLAFIKRLADISNIQVKALSEAENKIVMYIIIQ